MPNLVALIQAQGVTRVLSLRFADVLIIAPCSLMILGIGFHRKRYTKTGDDLFLGGRQILRAYRAALGSGLANYQRPISWAGVLAVIFVILNEGFS